MKISRLSISLRSLLALSIGLLAGFSGRSCRQQGAPVTGASVAAAEAPVSMAQEQATTIERTTAAAKQWFRALEKRLFDGNRLKPLATAEVEQIEALTSDELGVWLEEGRRLKVSYVLMDMLMERWAEIDRAAFVAWIDKLYEQPMPSTMMISGYMDSNPPGVTAALMVLRRVDPKGIMPTKSPKYMNITSVPVASKLGQVSAATAPAPKPDFEKISAEEAMRWLAARQNGFEELTEVARRLAKKDIKEALAWAEAMPRHLKQRQDALRSIVSEGKENTEWLLENVHLLGTVKDIKYALDNASKLYGSAAGRKTLMEWALSREVPAEREAGLAAVQGRLHSVSQKEAVELLSLVRDNGERGKFIEAMMDRYSGSENWEQLLPLLKSEPGRGTNSLGAGSAAQHLAKLKSVKEALEWADSLPPDGRRSAAYGGVWGEWWKQDAAGAATAALELPLGAERTAAVTMVARSIGARTPMEAMEWTRNLAAEERAQIFPILAEGLRQHHGAEAREEILDMLRQSPSAGDDPAFVKAAALLTPNMGTPTGKKQAAEWVSKMPDNLLRSELGRVMRDTYTEIN